MHSRGKKETLYIYYGRAIAMFLWYFYGISMVYVGTWSMRPTHILTYHVELRLDCLHYDIYKYYVQYFNGGHIFHAVC